MAAAAASKAHAPSRGANLYIMFYNIVQFLGWCAAGNINLEDTRLSM